MTSSLSTEVDCVRETIEQSTPRFAMHASKTRRVLGDLLHDRILGRLNAVPSPSCRPSYHSRVARTSAAASGRNRMRRVTRGRSAYGGLHSKVRQTRDVEREPPNDGPALRRHPLSFQVQPHVGLQTGSPTMPWRVQRAPRLAASGVQTRIGTSSCQYTRVGVG